MKLNHTLAVTLFSTAVLTSCAPPQPASEAPVNEVMTVESRQTQIEKISHWNISGAMAAKQGRKGWTASVSWQQNGYSNYQIRLFGPLGSGSVLLTKKGGRIYYQDGPKKSSGRSASQLLKQHTGVALPVANFYYWVKGIPAPGGAGNIQYDRYKHIKSFSQSGYRVNYQRYTSVKGIDLPSKILVQNGRVKLKFVVKSWSIG